jgi:hypothetical protein
VLAPDGLVVYIHNEELNLPSAAASFLYRTTGSTLLLPNDRWRPGNDFEYCSADRHELESTLIRLGADAQPLAQYLLDVYPLLYGHVARSEHWKIAAPVMRDYSPPVMNQIRRCVAMLRERQAVHLDDLRTSHLLQQHVEDRIFCEKYGFQIECSGYFELRHNSRWNTYFKDRPAATHFVRGTTRFGYATASNPPPSEEYVQELNLNPPVQEDEVMFIAYQYGLVARSV